METKRELTIPEAAKRAGRCKTTIRRYLKSGKLTGEIRNGTYYITKESLDAAIRENEEREALRQQNPPALLPGDWTPGEQPTLDETLENLKNTALRLSHFVFQRVEVLHPNDYELPVLVLTMQKVTDTIGKLIEYAPFLALKRQMEAMDAFKAWLDAAPPEQEDTVVNVVDRYQAKLLEDTGQLTPAQRTRHAEIYKIS